MPRRKKSFNVDELHIDTFETSTEPHAGTEGTVLGQETENCNTDYTHCWGECETQHSCLTEGFTCSNCGTQYTESGCTMDTPSIYCVSLAVQCDTNPPGVTCDGGQYC